MARRLEIEVAAELPNDEKRIQEALLRQFQHELIRHELVIIINGQRVDKRNRNVSS